MVLCVWVFHSKTTIKFFHIFHIFHISHTWLLEWNLTTLNVPPKGVERGMAKKNEGKNWVSSHHFCFPSFLSGLYDDRLTGWPWQLSEKDPDKFSGMKTPNPSSNDCQWPWQFWTLSIKTLDSIKEKPKNQDRSACAYPPTLPSVSPARWQGVSRTHCHPLQALKRSWRIPPTTSPIKGSWLKPTSTKLVSAGGGGLPRSRCTR